MDGIELLAVKPSAFGKKCGVAASTSNSAPPAPAGLQPTLPEPRGPLSAFLLGRLIRPPHTLPAGPEVAVDDWAGDDLQLALYVCYELHYRGFDGVDARWEWHPGLLAFRSRLEQAFETAVLDLVGHGRALVGSVESALWSLVDTARGPSLSGFVSDRATLGQVRELAVHRSAYQLKEADPHTWAIPRLAGGAKAAMVEIQADEYGGGVETDMHASLFAVTMAELGLDPGYGAYLDCIPGPTLATVNLISLFGLHRRLRGALVGHLAVFEMTSVGPMARYDAALARLGIGDRGRRFYQVHVEADAHHQLLASSEMAGRLAQDEPELAGDILFGARAVMAVERRFTQHVLGRWSAGRSSLRRPLGQRQPSS
jgi:hypothetical protein